MYGIIQQRTATICVWIFSKFWTPLFIDSCIYQTNLAKKLKKFEEILEILDKNNCKIIYMFIRVADSEWYVYPTFDYSSLLWDTESLRCLTYYDFWRTLEVQWFNLRVWHLDGLTVKQANGLAGIFPRRRLKGCLRSVPKLKRKAKLPKHATTTGGLED